MLQRAIVLMTIASAVMLSVLLFTTTPLTTGPLGILGFFVFMYMTALGVLTFLFRGISWIVPKFLLVPRKKIGMQQLTLKRSYYYASVVALVPVMLIALQSVGEVGIYQVLLVFFFVVIAWVYVTNRTV